MHDFDVVLLEDETDGYVAIVPALLGYHPKTSSLVLFFESFENFFWHWVNVF